MGADRRVAVERLTDVGDFEMYRFGDEVTDEPICRVALKVEDEQVEYGVWRKDDGEPSATGKLEWDDEDEWGDEGRKAVLTRIAGVYADGLPEVKSGLAFHIEPMDMHEEDEDDADDEDDVGNDEDEDEGEGEDEN